MVAADVQQQLSQERRQRPRVATLALIAALLPLLAGLGNAFVYNGAPQANVLSGLGRALEPGPVADLPSLHSPLYEFYSERFGLLLSIAVGNAVGLLAAGLALGFLGAATRARRPEFQRWAAYLPVGGAAVFALAEVLLAVGTNAAVQSALTAPRTVATVAGVDQSLVSTGELLERAGRFVFGVGFVLVSLNAMRCGLLFRFLGVLGIIAGALLVVPSFGGPLPIVQSAWFVGLAIVASARWPGATPSAWTSGKAEPWLSQQELKEARDAAASTPAARPAKRGRPGHTTRAASGGAAGLRAGAQVNGAVPDDDGRAARARAGKRKRKRGR